MMNKTLWIALFALLMASAVHAQSQGATYDDWGDMDSGPLLQKWQENVQVMKDMNMGLQCSAPDNAQSLGASLFANSFYALLIVAMVTALIYMAGSLFQLPALLAMAKQELTEMGVTAIVAILFITFLATSSFIPQSLFGFDVFNSATQYSVRMLEKVSTYSALLITANIALNSVYTLYVPLGPIRKAMTVQLGPALRPLIDGVSFSLQFLITTYGEWSVFMFLFCFIQKWFLVFFFPAGLFLRSFPQTRGGGNALIGLAVALSTIYPLMFHFDALIFDKQFPDTSLFSSVEAFYGAAKAIILQLTIGGAGSIFFSLSLIYMSPFLVTTILMAAYLFWGMIWDVLHLIVIFSILLPIMNIFVTLSLAREISRALGTELSLSAFAKLI